MRPRKYYVFYEHGQAVSIIEGSTAARRVNAGSNGFRTRLEAEEHFTWWNYQHVPWHLSTTEQSDASHHHHPS